MHIDPEQEQAVVMWIAHVSELGDILGGLPVLYAVVMEAAHNEEVRVGLALDVPDGTVFGDEGEILGLAGVTPLIELVRAPGNAESEEERERKKERKRVSE